MKKTILHIAESFGGGIITFIANLANEQQSRYRVIVAYGIRKETHKNFKDLFHPNIQFIQIENFHQRIKLSNEWKAIKELRLHIKDIKPDIIHMHSSQAGVLGKLACFDYKAVKIYSPHGFAFLKQDIPSWKKYIFRCIEKVFSWMNCTLVASSQTEFDVARSITSKAVLITNGINTASLNQYITTYKNKERPVVGMVGRALLQKNPALFNQIAEAMPHVQFEWIGDGELRHLLTAPNIHIVGWGPREEALEYVAMTDVYIMTSLWEGMPLALLEAMYLKKPCVVTDVVGNRDVIKNDINGYVCSNAYEFINKIQYLIDNKEENTRMGNQGHKDIINKYNSHIMAEKYNIVYNRYK